MYFSLILLCMTLTVVVQGQSMSELIVGDSTAVNGSWPWQLSVRYLGTHSCGAALLDATYAVCSAHCVTAAPDTYTVIAGTILRSCPFDDCEERRLISIVRHPDFTNAESIGYPNDVSVIAWEEPLVESTGRIEYITMASTEDQIGQTCYITGWGRSSGTDPFEEHLQEAPIDLLTVSECQTLWSVEQIHETHVCVYDNAAQAVCACNGDAGSPLVCQASGSSPWELVGVGSWSSSGCDPAWPSVYSRISSYRDWILSVAP